MNSHFRWNSEYLPKVLPADSLKFTTIREPISQYRSLYNFYYNAKDHRTDCDMPCWNEPFMSFLGTKQNNVKFETFVERLPNIFSPNHDLSFRAKNYQAFEMGMDHLNEDEGYIESSIQLLDDQFDLGNDFKICFGSKQKR